MDKLLKDFLEVLTKINNYRPDVFLNDYVSLFRKTVDAIKAVADCKDAKLFEQNRRNALFYIYWLRGRSALVGVGYSKLKPIMETVQMHLHELVEILDGRGDNSGPSPRVPVARKKKTVKAYIFQMPSLGKKLYILRNKNHRER